MTRRIAFFVFVLFLATTLVAASENSLIFRDLASRLGDGIQATAHHPVIAVALYEGQHFCFTECQEVRREFALYLTPKRLPGLAERKTLRWEWHVEQGVHNRVHYFYLLVLDRDSMRVWQIRVEANGDLERTLFSKAVTLMENDGDPLPDGFEVFTLNPAPD